MNVFLTVENYLEEGNDVNVEKLNKVSDTLGGILEGKWKKNSSEEGVEYSSIAEKVVAVHEESPYFTEILIATDIDNDIAIEIKALSESLPGVYIDNGSKRNYPIKESMSHLLGYTGEVSAEDLENLDYVESTDIVGKSGLEKYYDKRLKGTNGLVAWEVDAVGKTISNDEYLIKEPVVGENLYLTIDSKIQEKLYQELKKGVEEYEATGAAGVIEDVNTGEIIALVTYPSYDNNLFVGGISYKDYEDILKNPLNPLY
jgi:penicillin-binding protein 2